MTRRGLAAGAAALLESGRPQQWPKNLVVLAALLFALEFRNADSVLLAAAACALVTLVSAGSYVINDVIDAPLDRRHPSKRRRPIADGRLPARAALPAGLLAVAGALALAFLLSRPLALALALFAALLLGYSLWLKHAAIIELLVIAGGFVVRAVSGALAIGVAVSPWLYCCVFSLALFLAVGKRWAELSRGPQAASARPVLARYTPEFLRTLVMLAASTSVLSYTLYTFSAPNLPANHLMMLTAPIALYGILRYLDALLARGDGEAPERLLWRDRGILASLVVWVAACWAILQFGGEAGS